MPLSLALYLVALLLIMPPVTGVLTMVFRPWEGDRQENFKMGVLAGYCGAAFAALFYVLALL